MGNKAVDVCVAKVCSQCISVLSGRKVNQCTGITLGRKAAYYLHPEIVNRSLTTCETGVNSGQLSFIPAKATASLPYNKHSTKHKMKKSILLTAFLFSLVLAGYAQGNGNSNGHGHGQNKTSNHVGQNGNGNGYGHNNGNNGNNGGGNSGNSGGNAGAQHSTHVVLSNAIEITFNDNMSAYGEDVSLAFTTVNDYANGVESSEQQLKISSNKDFTVAVKTNSDKFTYSGNTTPVPSMPVTGVLGLKVTANNTGGSIAGSFSASKYATLTASNQPLISGADRGGNQTFNIQYKATPGFAYPAGSYSVDVVYTATQQ